MSQKTLPLLKLFKALHFVGLVMVVIGVFILLMSDIGQTVNGMVAISSLIGIGGVMISPFPVAVFIQWASQSQPKNVD